VNLSGEAEPFDTWIEPIAARLALPIDVDLARDQALTQRLELARTGKSSSRAITCHGFTRELNRVNPVERHYQILGGHRYLGQRGMTMRDSPLWHKAINPPPRRQM